MRLAWILFLLISAGVVALGVITVLNLAPDLEPLPDVDFETEDGGTYRLVELRSKISLAAFVTAHEPEERRERLSRIASLAETLPGRVRLVLFLSDDAPRADVPDAGRWRVLRGPRRDVSALATSVFGFDPEAGDALVACVDRAARVRSRYPLAAWEDVARDARFLLAIDSRPLLHAALNGSSAVLLALGFLFIRQKRLAAHMACMVLAALVTVVFLGSYVYYHYHVGSMPFRGEGWVRPVYFAVLLSHTVLAAFVAPLAGSLFFLAARRSFDRHRRIARWTLPLWLYVSLTGVLIYFMLYVWFAGV